MSQFTNRMDTETIQVFWVALQRGELAEDVDRPRTAYARGV